MNRSLRIISCAAAAALMLPWAMLPVNAEEAKSQVRFVVENNTFSASDGAAWEGTLIDEWVDIKENVSAADMLDALLKAHGYTQTGAADNYITDINGLSAGADAAQMGGWMVGFDDWYGNGGISTLKPENGDEITLSYSLDWGVDIGADYMSSSTKLVSLTIENGSLTPDFSPDVTEYTLTPDNSINGIRVTPTAENKNFRWKIYKNDYAPDDETADCKRTEEIAVSDGDALYIGVGHASWHSYMPDGAEETVYKINIGTVSGESSDSDTSKESAVSDTDKKNSDVSVDYMITALRSQLTPANNNYAVGDEWILMTNCRMGFCTANDAGNYFDDLKNEQPKRATDYAKYILVLTSAGYDPTRFNGTDLTAGLSDFDFAVKQGINGAAYTLIALDCNNYDIPAAPDGKEQTTREKLISSLIDAQLGDGGWAFFGETYEPDMTGIVIQALAPYYGKDSAVTKAVDNALKLLSEKQNSDGTYTSYGEPNCENSAQVVLALSMLGIDADKDERFVKNGSSALDGLKAFWLNDQNGFSHTRSGESNALSTVQSYEALCAYKLFKDNKNAFYDMSKANGSNTENSNGNSAADNSKPIKSPATGSAVPEMLLFTLLISCTAFIAAARKTKSDR